MSVLVNGFAYDIDSNGKVTVNGVEDLTTDKVIAIKSVDNEIWQENINHDWWMKVLPTDQWAPDGGSKTGPNTQPSPDKTVVLVNSGNTLVDSGGNVWGIDGNQQITVNGKVDQTTHVVTEIAYVNGVVWQENVNADWWSKDNLAQAWQGHSTTGPLTNDVNLGPSQAYTVNNPSGVSTINAATGDIVSLNDITQHNGSPESDTINGYNVAVVAGTVRTTGTGNSIAFINGTNDTYWGYGQSNSVSMNGDNNQSFMVAGHGGSSFNNGSNEAALFNPGVSGSVTQMASGTISFTSIFGSIEDYSFTNLGNGVNINVYGTNQLNLENAVFSSKQVAGGMFEVSVNSANMFLDKVPSSINWHAVNQPNF